MNILLRYLARTCFPPFLWHERQKPLCIIYNDNLDTTPMRELASLLPATWST